MRNSALRTIFLLFALSLLAPAVPAQSPAFEVASVKPNKTGTTERGGGPQPGRFVRTNVTLRQLIQMAYSQRAFHRREIAGSPSWIDAERFDIEAKFGDSAGNLGELYLPDGKDSPGLAYLMVRTLLAERFKLVVHSETRERPVYALVMARRDGRLGPQLRRSNVDCLAYIDAVLKNGGRPPTPPEAGKSPPCSMGAGAGRLIGNALAMSELADVLSPYTNRVVLDRTQLAGNFDLSLGWTPAPGEYNGRAPFDHIDPSAAEATSIFTALQEQLGLKLEATRGPVDVLVIDHVDRPTED
jgi:uncharacterized protein (TIGR03435 family)